jgi:hypothetical protein
MAMMSAQESMRFAISAVVMVMVWFSITAYANTLTNAQHISLMSGMASYVSGLVAYGEGAVKAYNNTYEKRFFLPVLPLDYAIRLDCAGGSLVVNASSFTAGSTVIYPYINCAGKSVGGSAIMGLNCLRVSRTNVSLVSNCYGTA